MRNSRTESRLQIYEPVEPARLVSHVTPPLS